MTFDVECKLDRIRSLSRAVTAWDLDTGVDICCYRRGICLMNSCAREIAPTVQYGYT